MLGRVDYRLVYEAMRAFNVARNERSADEIWICEHPPVFTQGIAGRPEHLLHESSDIPLICTDRGGQITYHGPGQVVAYPLVDLRPLGIFVKEYVYRLEHCVLRTLQSFGVTGHRVPGAPGIYVRLEDPFGHSALEAVPPRERVGVAAPVPFQGLGKIAALGIKVSRHCAYHGLALNVAMDLAPFERINPCGYPGLRTIDLATLGISADPREVAQTLGRLLQSHLSP